MFWLAAFRIRRWYSPFDKWVYLSRCLDITPNRKEAEMFDSPLVAADAVNDFASDMPNRRGHTLCIERVPS